MNTDMLDRILSEKLIALEAENAGLKAAWENALARGDRYCEENAKLRARLEEELVTCANTQQSSRVMRACLERIAEEPGEGHILDEECCDTCDAWRTLEALKRGTLP